MEKSARLSRDTHSHDCCSASNDNLFADHAALLDLIPDAVCVATLDRRLCYCNANAAAIFGWQLKPDLRGRYLSFPGQSNAQFGKACESVLKHGFWAGEVVHAQSAGRELIFQSRWTLLRDSRGDPKWIVIVHRDVTETRKLEAQLLRSQRVESIGSLAGGIAHDMNNVLAPILMSVRLMRDQVADEQVRSWLDVLEQSAQRGAELIKQILAFARGSKGQLEEVRIQELCEGLVRMLTEAFPRNVKIQCQIPANAWHLHIDPTQLHQLLMNLCVNARDAMPGGGVLAIEAENVHIDQSNQALHPHTSLGNYVIVRVKDTGTGIAPEILDRIFEPFFTTKQPGQGTGLGLATVHSIVKAHGGALNVKTQAGSGSVFEAYLPALVNGASPEQHTQPADIGRGNGEMILVVDDESAVCEMSKATLEANGYKVLTACDGAQGLATYAAHRDCVELVLADTRMPFMEGPAMIQALRRLDSNIQLLIISGLIDHEQVAAATGMRRVTFLPKPFTGEKLLQTVFQILHGEPAGNINANGAGN